MRTLELEHYGVNALKLEESVKIDGGGWIADLVAGVVHHIKCNCGSSQINEIDKSPILGTRPTHFS